MRREYPIRATRILMVAVVGALLFPTAGSGQSPVTTTSPGSARAANATRVETGPLIDGRLDDASWQLAQPLTDFVQHQPVEGAPTSERTEVRILFDDAAVYVGAWLYDSEPNRIIVGERRRDANLTGADAFLVVLDTYLDRQSGFVFGTTPGAIEYDGQVRGEGGNNTTWDGGWTVATSVDEEGWYAEMRIPFSTLRHRSGTDQTWGVNFTRHIGRKNEQVVWSPVSQQYSFFRLTEAGTLRGIEPPPRRVTTVTPYVMSAAQRVPRLDPEVTYPFEIGGDAKLGITPSLALDLTLNTDFAQVEADDQQVDLTRFSLFFPEKRPFFLENADLFSIGLQPLPSRTSGRTQLFHSRQIGVAAGRQVPIEWGGRLSGRAAGVDVGLLHMRTGGLAGAQEPTDWSVARLAWELPSRSRVGAMYTSRAARGGDASVNRTYGVDARLGIGESWTFHAMAGLSDSPGVDDGQEVFGFLGEYLSRNWYIRGYYDQVGENFNPRLGFIPYSGFHESSLRIERIIRPDIAWMREIRSHVRRTWAYNDSGLKEVDMAHFHLNFNWDNGAQFSPAVNWMHEGLAVPFGIRGTDIEVPAGIYTGWLTYATFRTNPSAQVSLNGRYDIGTFLSGDRVAGTLGISTRLGGTFTGGLGVTHNRISLPQGDYNTTLTRMNVQYAFGPGVFLQSLLQYSDQTGVWTGNVRFAWLDTAGTGLFLVYNERQTMDVTGLSGLLPRNSLETPERTFVIKFTRQFDVSDLTDF